MPSQDDLENFPNEDTGAPKFGVHDYPEIDDFEDLITLVDLAEKFGLKQTTVREMRFKEPRLPYLRFGGKIWISKKQFVWFLNKWQRTRLDSYYLDRKRRQRAGIPIGRGRPKK